MDILQQFVAYADDFEKTYMDDQWDRLRKYFHEDATYDVKSAAIPCHLTGPDAIFAGIKKSLDGFDRKFDKRELALVDDPVIEGDKISVNWAATYSKDDLDPYVLRGQSVATYRDGKLATLSDSIELAVEKALAEWVQATGFSVDPSYT
ncbi:MAG: nuclear transport factor 2 family protein [Pseudomonadales bacterium]